MKQSLDDTLFETNPSAIPESESESPDPEIPKETGKPWWFNKACSYCGKKDTPMEIYGNGIAKCQNCRNKP